MPLLTATGYMLKGVLSSGHGKVGAAAPAVAPKAAAAPLVAPAAAAPVAAPAPVAPAAAGAAVAAPAAPAAVAPAAAGVAAVAAPVAAVAAAAAPAAPAAAAGGAAGGGAVVGYVLGGGAVVGACAAGVLLLSRPGLNDDEKKGLRDFVSQQGDAEAQMVRRVFTADHEGRRAARALLAADGKRDSGGCWSWSSSQEEELCGLLLGSFAAANAPQEQQLRAAWKAYAGNSDTLSEAWTACFVDDFFEAYVDSLVPNLLLTWIFLREGPSCAADVFAMPFEDAMRLYPLYALTLESYLHGPRLAQLKEDWKGQDKSEFLVKLVEDSVQTNPQQFIPQSETQIEYTVIRKPEEKVGMNAIGCESGVYIIEVVSESPATEAIPSGGGAKGLKAGMRVLDVAGKDVKSTADIGTAVHTPDGAPRTEFKVKVAESCARHHRVNKVQAALRADKEVITKRWREFLLSDDKKFHLDHLLDCYNLKTPVKSPEEFSQACARWSCLVHAPCVPFAKEYIPKLGDTPVGDCAIQ
eukprot:Hpha_TRINITY_DN15221_c0_g3::TRINITY_DN15221_c0_g3_i1::g.66447::m.66447